MESTRSEQVILVDEKDRQIGEEEKLIAHQKGLLHRAFSIFVLRDTDKGVELLLQQRHKDKYHCPGLWTNTCCSHPRVDESTLDAAYRRLQEEMGFQLPLRHVGAFQYRATLSNGLIENEYDHVFVGIYDGETIRVNPQEVQEFRWVDLKTLQKDLAEHPDLYTPWFSLALELLPKQYT